MALLAWALPAPAGVGQLVAAPRRVGGVVSHREGRRVAAAGARRAPHRPPRVAVMKASPEAGVAASAAPSSQASPSSATTPTTTAASTATSSATAGVAAAGIRTVAVAGKDGCGKTALVAALLSLAAAKRGGGKGVDGGAPEEVAHGMTLYNHVYCAEREGDYRGTSRPSGGKAQYCRAHVGTVLRRRPFLSSRISAVWPTRGTDDRPAAAPTSWLNLPRLATNCLPSLAVPSVATPSPPWLVTPFFRPLATFFPPSLATLSPLSLATLSPLSRATPCSPWISAPFPAWPATFMPGIAALPYPPPCFNSPLGTARAVNVIDTCGHIDRLPLLATALAVSTAAVFVTTPTVGVDGACKRVWERVSSAAVPSVAFVNCFRLADSSVEAGGHPAGRWAAALHAIEAALGQFPVVLFAPAYEPETGAFLGLIDVLAGALCRDSCRFLGDDKSPLDAAGGGSSDGADTVPLPPSAVAEAAAHREHAVEALADVDDAVMEAYLDVGPSGVPAGLLATALRTAVASRSVLPVIAGSAAEGIGIRALDDLLLALTPAFGEGAGWPAHEGGGGGGASDAAAAADADADDADAADRDGSVAEGQVSSPYAAERVYTSGADALAEAAWRRAGGPVTPVPPNATAPVVAVVYGLSLHAYSGRLTEVLVVAGVLTKHAKLVLNPAGGGGGAVASGGSGGSRRVSPARLLRRRAGGELEEVTSAGPGELVCLEKIDGAAYGDTLTCGERPALQLRPLPRPYGRCTFTLPVGADPRADDKLLRALGRILEEDPSLRLSRNEETGELLLSGCGLLHLDIVKERLATEAGVVLPLATPHVAYHETLTGAPVRATGRVVKQTGGSGQYAVVEVEVAPLPRDGGFVWTDATKGGVVSRSFAAAAGRGAADALRTGPLGGYPLTDVAVTLVDGKMHSVDSSEGAFFHAAAAAVRAAAAKAATAGHAALLEPIMRLAVTVDEAHIGRVSKDLATRRGHLSGFRPAEGDLSLVVVEADVPLGGPGGLLHYSKALDALTSGTATYTMAVARYEVVTSHAAAAVLAVRRGGGEGEGAQGGGKGGGGGKRKR